MPNENLSVVKTQFRRVSRRAWIATGQLVWPVVVGWFQGSGSDCAEEPVFRCEPVTQATETFLECPARTRLSSVGDASGVVDEVPPDDVAEPALQRSDRLARGLAFGELAVVVARPGLWRWRIWVIAAQCRAWFNRRLPRRHSRWTIRPPEENSIGAVPV